MSTGVTILQLLGMYTSSCESLSSKPVTNWQNFRSAGDGKGVLSIEKVTGNAVLNETSLTAGVKVPSGSDIEVKSGFLLASLPDQSIIKLSEQARLSVDLDSKKGGTLSLKRGGLLAVVRKSNRMPYLIRNASAVVGIKGTVFYSQVLSNEDKEESDIPSQASDYFCICNGGIDFLSDEFTRLQSERVVYHRPFFLVPGQNQYAIEPTQVVLNHDDEEIYDVIQEMRGEKHETNWLFP